MGSNHNKADGVAILNQKPLTSGEGQMGSFSTLDIHRAEFVNNIYSFNEKNDRYELLEELLSHMLGWVLLVLGGDFNCVLSRTAR